MSPSEIANLTLAQAVYYMQERYRKQVSASEAKMIQSKQSEASRKKQIEDMNARIAWANGQLKQP